MRLPYLISQNLRAILKTYHILATKNRIIMLKIFLEADEALTHRFFLKKLSPGLDRISVFRTLELFTKKGIIHRIPGADRVNRYSLRENDDIIYANFICNSCKKIVLLKTIIPEKIKLPKGFKKETVQILISGECESCKK